MRGRLHQIAFFCFIPMGIALVAAGPSARARAATTIYAVSLVALYGVSALYHRVTWSPAARQKMRRLDHATIFVLIAGTYTPMAMFVLTGGWRVGILTTVWTVAVIGIVLEVIALERMHRLGLVMYIGLGWVAIVALPQLVSRLDGGDIASLLAGGVFYTTGAIVYAMRRPDPDPRVFGYHEVYHAFVIAGSVCHYLLIFSLTTAAD